jgi:hypothetical protein
MLKEALRHPARFMATSIASRVNLRACALLVVIPVHLKSGTTSAQNTKFDDAMRSFSKGMQEVSFLIYDKNNASLWNLLSDA